ncbi:MAG: GNAT family N-acetyltransferase [Alphaproteobacteria bacterium]|nr:GNAT family N-acetyltransferase [Alphaproteobacteria bacterium]
MKHFIHNIHKTQEYFLRALSKETFEGGGVSAFSIGNMKLNLNWSVQTGDMGEDCEATIRAVEAFYQDRDLSWRWLLNPSLPQENLRYALKKRGYHLSFTAPVFVGSLTDPFSDSSLQGFDIREGGAEKLSDWILPIKEAFQVTNEDAHFYQEAHLSALQKGAFFRHFVGYANGIPVSAATLSLSPYGARLDDLGTLSAYQNKGFGGAMALHRMRIAKDLGYDWVCLEASKHGGPLYKKMGFQELYRIKVYRKKIY